MPDLADDGASVGGLKDGLCRLSKGLPIGNDAVGLVSFAGGAYAGVEVGEFLRFVLGFVQVADGAQAVGVTGLGHVEGGQAEPERQLWN